MADNRVIGKNNKIPWSIKEDMSRFMKMTMGWPCIMGRKTWESLPKKPLPGRLNVIVSGTMTSNENTDEDAVKIFPSLPAAVEYCAGYEKIFICGGEAIYRQAFETANTIELTLIHGQYDGDTFFPEIDTSLWSVTNTVDYETFSFITYKKNKKELL